MEALETVINFWEDALDAYQTPATSEESEFCREIQSLLDLAWQLQDQSELLFLDQRSILFRNNLEKSSLHRSLSDPNFDSAESFASALDQVSYLSTKYSCINELNWLVERVSFHNCCSRLLIYVNLRNLRIQYRIWNAIRYIKVLFVILKKHLFPFE